MRNYIGSSNPPSKTERLPTLCGMGDSSQANFDAEPKAIL